MNHAMFLNKGEKYELDDITIRRTSWLNDHIQKVFINHSTSTSREVSHSMAKDSVVGLVILTFLSVGDLRNLKTSRWLMWKRSYMQGCVLNWTEQNGIKQGEIEYSASE